MANARALALAAALLALAGCGRPFTPATPQGFVELEERYSDYDYRATTPDGVVLAIRAIDNKQKGDMAFWTQSIENHMRSMGGYALLEKREVTCEGNHKGTQLRFGHDEGNTPHIYAVTIFVIGERIFLLEAGGTKQQVERMAASIDWSIKSFRPKLSPRHRDTGDRLERAQRPFEHRPRRRLCHRLAYPRRRLPLRVAHLTSPRSLCVGPRHLPRLWLAPHLEHRCAQARLPLVAHLGDEHLPGKARPIERHTPPAIAGTTVSCSPPLISVSRPSRKRMSSSPR